MQNETGDAVFREMIDREAIRDVLTRYGVSLDSRDWALFKTCFTKDAKAFYGEEPVIEGYPGIEKFVRFYEDYMEASQHLISNFVIEIDGDEARTTCYLHAVHYLANTQGGDTWSVGGYYTDQLIRTTQGWKIKSRKLTLTWGNGNSNLFAAAQAKGK
jgi:3-phenylpropionate/cinnamic acid dioxygenase small subunit